MRLEQQPLDSGLKPVEQPQLLLVGPQRSPLNVKSLDMLALLLRFFDLSLERHDLPSVPLAVGLLPGLCQLERLREGSKPTLERLNGAPAMSPMVRINILMKAATVR